jgi:hypothetical protein
MKDDGDRHECEALRAGIDRRIELAETAREEGRLSDAGEHLAAALALHRALIRLERAIWRSALAQLRESGVVLGNGGTA